MLLAAGDCWIHESIQSGRLPAVSGWTDFKSTGIWLARELYGPCHSTVGSVDHDGEWQRTRVLQCGVVLFGASGLEPIGRQLVSLSGGGCDGPCGFEHDQRWASDEQSVQAGSVTRQTTQLIGLLLAGCLRPGELGWQVCGL